MAGRVRVAEDRRGALCGAQWVEDVSVARVLVDSNFWRRAAHVRLRDLQQAPRARPHILTQDMRTIYFIYLSQFPELRNLR